MVVVTYSEDKKYKITYRRTRVRAHFTKRSIVKGHFRYHVVNIEKEEEEEPYPTITDWLEHKEFSNRKLAEAYIEKHGGTNHLLEVALDAFYDDDR